MGSWSTRSRASLALGRARASHEASRAYTAGSSCRGTRPTVGVAAAGVAECSAPRSRHHAPLPQPVMRTSPPHALPAPVSLRLSATHLHCPARHAPGGFHRASAYPAGPPPAPHLTMRPDARMHPSYDPAVPPPRRAVAVGAASAAAPRRPLQEGVRRAGREAPARAALLLSRRRDRRRRRRRRVRRSRCGCRRLAGRARVRRMASGSSPQRTESSRSGDGALLHVERARPGHRGRARRPPRPRRSAPEPTERTARLERRSPVEWGVRRSEPGVGPLEGDAMVPGSR